jgi:SH3-like domain-containing protein
MRRAPLLALAVLSGACATARPALTPVDLQPARLALEAARQAGAPEQAAASYTAAESQLKKAEGLAPAKTPDAREAAVIAEWMARLAAAEARGSSTAATVRSEAQSKADTDTQRLQARLRRSEEEQRRLEERLAAEQRDLDFTEMELIRTKARLKGLETKAEASSAIAEARILLRRAEGRGAMAAASQQSLGKAEELLLAENFGAAIFFALKAQDLASRAQDGGESRRAAGPQQVTVRVAQANLRQGPGPREVVVGKAPRGAVLPVKAAQGDWLQVTYGGVTGWVSRSVVQ